MRIVIEMKQLPGKIRLTGEINGKKAVVMCAGKAEATLKAADLLARYAKFLADMATAQAQQASKPKIIIPDSIVAAKHLPH